MPTAYCKQLKTEYEHLKTLKKEFVLEFEKAKASGLRSRAWKLLDQLEAAKDALKEKLERFITETKALAEIEKLLAGGADKGSVAMGLAGDYITFVWQLRRKNKSGLSAGGAAMKKQLVDSWIK